MRALKGNIYDIIYKLVNERASTKHVMQQLMASKGDIYGIIDKLVHELYQTCDARYWDIYNTIHLN